MKILAFGGSGQLGYELLKRAHDLHFSVFAPVLEEVDIADAAQVRHLVRHLKPDVVVNCAAYTAVDRAEDEVELAFRINRDGVNNIASAAREAGAFCIHISTDYVFDGEATRAYREDDATHPLNVYGASKLAGEEVMRQISGDAGVIVRTAWLHGMKGQNFIGAMLRLFREKEVVRVVNDQVGCPTWAGWLAEVLLDLARIRPSGVLHAVSRGPASWYDFAELIHRLVKPGWEGNIARLETQTSAEIQRPARRPKYSVLDCSKLEALLGRPCMGWEEGVRAHLRDLGYGVSRG